MKDLSKIDWKAIDKINRELFQMIFDLNPRQAMEDANTAFDEANRAEYERQPVSLW